MTTKEKEILLAFAANDMNSCKGARVVFMSRSSFYYHFNNIKAKTGLNPLKFYDLVKLLGMVEVVRCGDCEYWCEDGYCKDPDGPVSHVFEDDFCSYGERRVKNG